MTATETIERIDEALKDAATGLDILEHLEFDIELPCEHRNHGVMPWHEGAGELLVDFLPNPCEACGAVCPTARILLCRSAFEHAGERGLSCSKCKASHVREYWWSLAGTVR